jgi:hypothetical protein
MKTKNGIKLDYKYLLNNVYAKKQFEIWKHWDEQIAWKTNLSKCQ